MKKILVLFLISWSSFSQKTIEIFESIKLGETREIVIGLPASYEKNPTKKYPILILLDGDYLFDPFYGAANYAEYWDDIPETIIVGIHQNKNEERYDDCNQEEGLPAGKGTQFFEFIGAELLPYIEKKYRIAPFRIIGGHDITAGFLNFFLYKDDPIFNGYISLSPELAVGMETSIPKNLSKIKKPIFYYQSTGDGDLKTQQEAINNLDQNMKQNVNPIVNYKFENFKDASHYSLVLHSIPSALYQIFESYRPITVTEYNDKIAILQSGYVDYLLNKYDVIYKNLNLNFAIRISDFKAIEAAILKNKAYSELDQLAEIANKNYPKAMLGEYELALMYEKNGDPARAAKRYQNASQMEEIGDLTKTMMLNKFDDMKSLSPKK